MKKFLFWLLAVILGIVFVLLLNAVIVRAFRPGQRVTK